MTMLEKAARAVIDCIDELGVKNYPDFDVRITRAVLEAVREPDRATILAGDKFHYSVPGAFTAMIDHILNEGQNT